MGYVLGDALISLIALFLIAILVLMVYRYRRQIIKFAKDPEYGKGWRPSRETELKRDIEDAEAELQYLADQKEKGE